MKEYKILTRKAFEGFKSFEERINQHAREGWEVKTSDKDLYNIILERSKNRY